MVVGLQIAAVAVAAAGHYLYRQARTPQQGVTYAGLAYLVVGGGLTLLHLSRNRRYADAYRAALSILVAAAAVCCAAYWQSIGPAIFYPADILIWSESDFVNDIIKYRVGYPLYTDDANNESFVYPPGAQLLTYFIAWLAGAPASVPAYRLIQVAYTIGAALLAMASWQTMSERNGVLGGYRGAWCVFVGLFSFLAATNAIANSFTHNLHNDALALLVSAGAFYVSVDYAARRKPWHLAAMAVLPAAGFMVKQNLVAWLVLFGVQLALFDRPRSWRRVGGVVVLGLAAYGAVVVTGWVLWGGFFRYWIFDVLNSLREVRGISLLRSFRNMLDAWAYVAGGLLGGLVVLRRQEWRRFAGPWAIWLLLMLSEIYSSGIGWMKNHLGPGCLIAAVWMGIALAHGWRPGEDAERIAFRRLGHGLVVCAVVLGFSGLGFVRVPMPSIPDEARRYAAEIESHFEGQPPGSVLLDVGSWVYLKHSVVMKDRAPTVATRGYTQVGDFRGILERLSRRQYRKILVRGLHSPEFWYDYYLWPKSSGIRKALLQHYREIGRIQPGWNVAPDSPAPYLFGEISVLVPK